MSAGNQILIWAVVSLIVSIFMDYFAGFSSGKNAPNAGLFKKSANVAYFASVLFVVLASLHLWMLFLSDRFDISYVQRYSSIHLPVQFKISAFWAGQEGSFLFWTLSLALLGIWHRLRNDKLHTVGNIFSSVVLLFFLFINLKASPFMLSPQTSPDGAGLNPLLQNYWMVIHPPLLFIGYAAAVFPLAHLVNYAFSSNYSEMNMAPVKNWVTVYTFFLGAGIIVGAVWAYEVLGWGGYWGWDPVENSSLIPWLTGIALLHGLSLQKRSNALVKVNFALAGFSFLLVIYATFLTRSGVLADFSVHSFENLGLNNYLIVFMCLIVLLIIFSLQKLKSFRGTPVRMGEISPSSILIWSVWILTGLSVMILIGTSWPLISAIFGKPTQVQSHFYNTVSLPFVVLSVIALFLFLQLVEKKAMISGAMNVALLLTKAILAIVTALVFSHFGLEQPLYLFLIFVSAWAIWDIGESFVRMPHQALKRKSILISHLGLVVLLVGIMGNGFLKSSRTVSMEKNKIYEDINRTFTYKGLKAESNGKNKVLLEMKEKGRTTLLEARYYFSNYSRGWMREPYIKRGWLSDMYFSPVQITRKNISHSNMVLHKNEMKDFNGTKIHFTDFEMGNHQTENKMLVKAALHIMNGRESQMIRPAMVLDQQGVYYQDAKFAGSGKNDSIIIRLNKIDVENHSIQLTLNTLNAPAVEESEILSLDIKKEPFISMVWFGFFLILAGLILNIKTGRVENGKAK